MATATAAHDNAPAVGNAETNHDLIKEFRIRKLRTAGIEIGTGMKNKLILPRFERGPFKHRAIGTAIGIGHGFGNQIIMSVAKAVQLDTNSGRRAAFCRIQYMGGQSSHAGPPLSCRLCWAVASPPGRHSDCMFCAEPIFKRFKIVALHPVRGKEGIT